MCGLVLPGTLIGASVPTPDRLVCTLLINAGGSLSLFRNDGLTPANAARNGGYEDIVDLLRERGAPGAPDPLPADYGSYRDREVRHPVKTRGSLGLNFIELDEWGDPVVTYINTQRERVKKHLELVADIEDEEREDAERIAKGGWKPVK